MPALEYSMGPTFSRLDNTLRSVAKFGDSVGCRDLIAAGARPDATDLDGMSALHVALHAGNSPPTSLVLIEYANPKHADWAGRTALHWAARYAPAHVIQKLIDSGWDPEATDGCGCTPLMSAASEMRVNPRMQLAKAIETLSRHSPIDAIDDTGSTALMMLAGASTKDSKSSMITDDDKTAIERGIQTLLDAGANPILVDPQGKTALSRACSTGDDSSVLLLLSTQAASMVDEDGLDPLMHACLRCEHPGHLGNDARQALIGLSDLSRRNDHGFSALSMACSGLQDRYGSNFHPKLKAVCLIMDLARATADPDDLSLCIEILSPTGKSPLHDELTSLHDLAALRKDTPRTHISSPTPRM